MDEETPQPPDRPIEEWTDADLVEQYHYTRAEAEEHTDKDRDDTSLERLREEIRRRGLEPVIDEIGPDASPGSEETDSNRHQAD